MALAISVAVPPENKPTPEVSLINMADVFLKEDLEKVASCSIQRNHHLPNERHFKYPIQVPCQMDRMGVGAGRRRMGRRPIKKLKCPDFTTVKSKRSVVRSL